MSQGLEFPRSMGEVDTLVWHLAADLPLAIVLVSILDRAPDAERLRRRVEGAIDRIPRLRQRVVSPAGPLSPPLWIEVSELALSRHFQRTKAPGKGSLADVLNVAQSMAVQPFKPSQPLWEFRLLEDLAEGKAALIQKFHHAMLDGVSGVLLMAELYDQAADVERDTGGENPASPNGEHDLLILSTAALLRRIAGQARGWQQVASSLVSSVATNPLEVANQIQRTAAIGQSALSPVARERSTASQFLTFSVPTDSLKRAAKSVDCKLNDAFVAGIAGGWRRYHDQHGAAVDKLRMAVPISLRGVDSNERAGNAITIARVPLPISVLDPRARMQQSRDLITGLRNEPLTRHVDLIAGLANAAAGRYSARFLAALARSTDFTASSVQGPPEPLYLAGARVARLCAFGPTVGAATNFTLFSYAGEAEVALNVDPIAIPDPERLLGAMKLGFDEVLELG